MRISINFMFAALCILVANGEVKADVKVNGLFSDHAVLQRRMPVPVWGSARDGEKIIVKIQNQRVRTTAKDAKWMVRLKPMEAGGPYTMTLIGDNTIVLNDIMVGEVWVCSGQSNMIWWLGVTSNAARNIPNANDADLRLFQVPPVTLDAPSHDIASG